MPIEAAMDDTSPAPRVSPANALCCRFSPDDSLVAASFSDGSVQVYDSRDGREAMKLEAPRTEGPMSRTGLPAPVMRFRKGQSRLEMTRRPLLLVGTVDQDLQQWNLRPREDESPLVYAGGAYGSAGGEQILAMDYHPEGSTFAVAGTDKPGSVVDRPNPSAAAVRIFDDATKTCVATLVGHQNRVMCVKYARFGSQPMLVSGGFDGLRLWDLRENACVRSLAQGTQGVDLSGDAIDCHGTTLLTASRRNSNQLQLWDLRTFKLLRETALHCPAGAPLCRKRPWSANPNLG